MQKEVYAEIRNFYEMNPHGKRSSSQERNLRYSLIKDQVIQHYSSLIIDVGCGVGELHLSMIDIGDVYVGIDISRTAIEKAKKKLNDGEFIVASACFLPLRKESVGFVICSEVLEHIPDIDLALVEMSRIISEGGHLVITTPNAMNLRILFSSLLAQLIGSSRTEQLYDKPIYLSNITSLLQEFGHSILHIEFFFSKPQRHSSLFKNILCASLDFVSRITDKVLKTSIQYTYIILVSQKIFYPIKNIPYLKEKN